MRVGRKAMRRLRGIRSPIPHNHKKIKAAFLRLFIFLPGGADRDRTGDLMTASQALSQLSYDPREASNVHEPFSPASQIRPTIGDFLQWQVEDLSQWESNCPSPSALRGTRLKGDSDTSTIPGSFFLPDAQLQFPSGTAGAGGAGAGATGAAGAELAGVGAAKS